MTGTRITLEEGVEQVRRVWEQLKAARWQLIGIKVSLPEAPEEGARLQDVGDDMNAVTALRVTIDCVLNDDLEPALRDLEEALARS